MKLATKLKTALTAFGAVTLLGACENFEFLHEKELKEQGFTQEQAEVGAAEGLRKLFSEEEELESGKTSYKLQYGGISDEDVLFTVKSIRTDLEKMLDVHDDLPGAKFLKNTGLQPQLEQQEKIFQYHEERLQLKVLHRTFDKLIQGKPASSRSTPGNVSEEEYYSLADSFPFQPLPEFSAEYVQSARDKQGNLPSEMLVEDFREYASFYEKEPNPEYQIDKGKEPERLVQRKREVRITSYNLDGDKEKIPDYIEVFRLKDGNPEPLPAIKVFKPNGTGDLEIVVADDDQQGELGYGIPDEVEEVQRIESGRDLKETELIDFIFKRVQKMPREYPEGEEINKLYIVKSGTAVLESYEIKEEGWESFLPDYHSISPRINSKGKVNKRITVYVKTEMNEEEDHDFAPIAEIALYYEVDARVMEFYKPNEKFAGKKYRITAQGRDVEVRDEEGQIKKYDVKALLQEKPYRIDFDRNQEKRWEILDKNSDGKQYEAKREIARPGTIEWEK